MRIGSRAPACLVRGSTGLGRFAEIASVVSPFIEAEPSKDPPLACPCCLGARHARAPDPIAVIPEVHQAPAALDVGGAPVQALIASYVVALDQFDAGRDRKRRRQEHLLQDADGPVAADLGHDRISWPADRRQVARTRLPAWASASRPKCPTFSTVFRCARTSGSPSDARRRRGRKAPRSTAVLEMIRLTGSCRSHRCDAVAWPAPVGGNRHGAGGRTGADPAR